VTLPTGTERKSSLTGLPAVEIGAVGVDDSVVRAAGCSGVLGASFGVGGVGVVEWADEVAAADCSADGNGSGTAGLIGVEGAAADACFDEMGGGSGTDGEMGRGLWVVWCSSRREG
jgi:hypothetical protein